MKLSFIIPVYNKELYIARCLDSLLNQNISIFDYEIIIVNDGSTDSSINIIEFYKNKYPNIILLNKKNNGAASARNYGIGYCKGKYVWMIDADDSILENSLKDLLEYIEVNNLDFLSLPINDVFNNKVVLSNQKNKPKLGVVVNNIQYLDRYCVEYSSCSFIVKRIYLSKVRFIEGITQEDFDFVIRLLEQCKRISSFSIKKGFYNYFVGIEGSVTNNIKNREKYIKTLDSFYISINYMQNLYLANKDNSDDYAYYAHRYVNNVKCYALSYLLYFPLSYQDRLQFYRKYKRINIFCIGETRFLSKKIRPILFIYRSPCLFKLVLKFLSIFIAFKEYIVRMYRK